MVSIHLVRTASIFLSLFLIGPGCSRNVEPKTSRPAPVTQDLSYCEEAQHRLQILHCPEGEPTKRGKTFAQFCRETQQNGVFINPKCLAEIEVCSQVDLCTSN